MAKKKVRLLCDSHLGKGDEVITMDTSDIGAAKTAGLVDDHADAVAYAESLKVAPAEDKPLE